MKSIPTAAFAGDLLLQQNEQCSSCCSHQHRSCPHQSQLRGSFLLLAQTDLQQGSTMGAQGPQQNPVSSLDLSPLGSMGFPLALGHPGLALAVVVGTQTGVGGSSAAALVCPGLSSVARVCSQTWWEHGRLRCCWSCTAAAQEHLPAVL